MALQNETLETARWSIETTMVGRCLLTVATGAACKAGGVGRELAVELAPAARVRNVVRSWTKSVAHPCAKACARRAMSQDFVTASAFAQYSVAARLPPLESPRSPDESESDDDEPGFEQLENFQPGVPAASPTRSGPSAIPLRGETRFGNRTGSWRLWPG